uniref:Uncharacterized protein n=1 Tax=Cacopsylla melanoneura TaxID=428564 RepID=A0A8D8ZWZ4_9HEMI
MPNKSFRMFASITFSITFSFANLRELIRETLFSKNLMFIFKNGLVLKIGYEVLLKIWTSDSCVLLVVTFLNRSTVKLTRSLIWSILSSSVLEAVVILSV